MTTCKVYLWNFYQNWSFQLLTFNLRVGKIICVTKSDSNLIILSLLQDKPILPYSFLRLDSNFPRNLRTHAVLNLPLLKAFRDYFSDKIIRESACIWKLSPKTEISEKHPLEIIDLITFSSDLFRPSALQYCRQKFYFNIAS